VLLAIIFSFLTFHLPPQFPLGFLLGIAIFLTALLNTQLALIILILSMLLSPEIGMGQAGGRIVVLRAEDVFLFLVFFGWLAKLAINKEVALLKSTPLNRPIFVYMFVCIFATFFGIVAGRIQAKYAVFYLLKYFEYFCLFFLVVNNIRDMRQIKIFTFFLLLTCFLVCLYGWTQIGKGGRVSAPFEGEQGEPNTFGGYLVLMMALIISFILYSQSAKQRFMLLGFLVFIVPPFLFTLSRSSWLAFFGMYISLILISERSKLILVFGLICIILLAVLYAPRQIKGRVEETFTPGTRYNIGGKKIVVDESTAARIGSWSATFVELKKRPLLGQGIPAKEVVDNQYGRVLREAGIIGFGVFIWLMVRIFNLGKEVYYNLSQDNKLIRGLSLGFMAGFIGLLIHAFGVATFILIRIMEPFWFLAAILASLEKLDFFKNKNFKI
jgi:hypothetical protein